MEKLITFAVPCYNSAAYMDHCIETLLTAGEEAEIILVDDGSTRDDTPAKCDQWAERYPDIIRTIHQPNGGHGEGVNQGICHAKGPYYKVVDSDDWLDTDALAKVMDKLRKFAQLAAPVDMVIANTPESLGMCTEIWEYLCRENPALYRHCRGQFTNLGSNIPGYQGRKRSVKLYRLARKIYKFNR